VAGPNKFSAPCGCCECPQFLAVTVRCTDGTAVSGATVTIKDSGDTEIDSCTTGAAGGCTFTFVTAPGTITVEVDKTGYTSASTSVDFATCNLSRSAVLTICPTSFTLQIRTAGCPIIPATYSITGDVTASGSLDANGSADVVLTMPTDDCLVDFTVGITPSTGYGAASASSPYTNINPCRTMPYGITWGPDATHVSVVYGDRFMPRTLSYSDDYGSCTLTFNNASQQWEGSYTYSSSKALGPGCGGLLEP
jgi:hypothetical protein